MQLDLISGSVLKCRCYLSTLRTCKKINAPRETEDIQLLGIIVGLTKKMSVILVTKRLQIVHVCLHSLDWCKNTELVFLLLWQRSSIVYVLLCVSVWYLAGSHKVFYRPSHKSWKNSLHLESSSARNKPDTTCSLLQKLSKDNNFREGRSLCAGLSHDVQARQ